jgi:hypothetical protein
MFYWAGLHKADFQEQLAEGVKVLLMMASRLLASQPKPTPTPALRILPAPDVDDEDEGN